MIKQWSAALIAASLLAGCATVTARPEGGAKTSRKPDYQVSKNYFFWGLAGVHTIDVADVCDGLPADQMQSQFTFVNGVFSTITFGIYLPKTAKVWCTEGGTP